MGMHDEPNELMKALTSGRILPRPGQQGSCWPTAIWQCLIWLPCRAARPRGWAGVAQAAAAGGNAGAGPTPFEAAERLRAQPASSREERDLQDAIKVRASCTPNTEPQKSKSVNSGTLKCRPGHGKPTVNPVSSTTVSTIMHACVRQICPSDSGHCHSRTSRLLCARRRA